MLLERITELGRRAQRLSLLQAVAWCAVGILCSIVILGAVDAIVQWHDPGMRWISAAIFWTAALVMFWLWLRPVLKTKDDPVQTAQLVERWYPDLKDRLSSAIDFLQLDEANPTAGSAALRRKVILETNADIENLNLDESLDAQPARRAMIGSGILLLIILIIGVLNWGLVGTALARLAAPWAENRWPHKNHLTIKNPMTSVVRGDACEIEITDEKEELPPDVKIHYRFVGSDGRTKYDEQPLNWNARSIVVRREKVLSPFAYRVTGGDDDFMAWQSVEVVDPLRIEKFAAEIIPPSYTNWPRYKSSERITALRGSEVIVNGRATRPLKSAKLQVGKQSIPLKLNNDSSEFSSARDSTSADTENSAWKLTESATYNLMLTDLGGLTNEETSQWETVVIADQPPQLNWNYPSGSLYITPEAKVPLRGIINDDIAVRSIKLKYAISALADQGEKQVVLDQGPEKPNAPTAEQMIEIAAGRMPGDKRILETEWDSSVLKFPAGTSLVITITADDYAGQVTTTQPRTIAVITPLEMVERLTTRHNAIMAELARILKLQTDCRDQLTPLISVLTEQNSLPNGSQMILQTADQSERQIVRSLVGSSEGVIQQVKSLITEFELNQLQAHSLAAHCNEMLVQIQSLQRESLPLAERELALATRITTPNELAKTLQSAQQAQNEIINALTQLQQNVSETSSLITIQKEVEQLLLDEQELQKLTVAMTSLTLGKQLSQLAADQVATLQLQSVQQGAMANRLDKIGQKLTDIRPRLDEAGKASADGALELLRTESPSSLMRTAATGIQQNRLGQATDEQQRIIATLTELISRLDLQKANTAANAEANRNELIKASDEELTKLRQKEEGLRKKMKEIVKKLDDPELKRDSQKRQELVDQLQRLRNEHKDLQAQAAKLAEQLKRLQVEKPAAQIQKALERLQRAEQAMQKAESSASKSGDGPPKPPSPSNPSGDNENQQQAKKEAKLTLDELEQAAKELEEAQKQLREENQQLKQELQNLEMQKLQDQVQGILKRQESVLEQSVAIKSTSTELKNQIAIAIQEKKADLERQQTRLTESAKQLATTEQSISDDTKKLSEQVAQHEVIAQELNIVSKTMTQAAEKLTTLEFEVSNNAQDRAISQLKRILVALEPPEQQNSPPAPPKPPGPNPPPPQQNKLEQQLQQLKIAEIKLLKLMQEGVNQRTIELDRRRAGRAELTPAEKQAYTELAEEQRRIRESVMKMLPKE